MKWSSARWVLFTALFLIFISTCLKPILNYLGYWTVFYPADTVEKIVAPDYNSAVQTFVQGPMQQLTSAVPTAQQDVDMSFEFKVTGFPGEYENIIQTADNNGIYIQISAGKLPRVLLGQGGKNKYIYARLDNVNPLSVNTWHTIRIHAWNQHRVIVWFDHVRTVDINNPSINFDVSHIQLGNGSTNVKSQSFECQIKNFTLTYHEINFHRTDLFALYSDLLCLIGILLFILFLKNWVDQPILTKNEKIEWFSLSLLIAFFAMMTYHFIVSIYYPGRMNTFIYSDPLPFNDALTTLWYGLNPYDNPIPGGYFPFAYLFFCPLHFVTGIALPIMLTLFAGSVVIFVTYFFRLQVIHESQTTFISNIKNIFIVSFLSYPFWFAFERGNMEDFIFIFLALFLYCYQQKMVYRAAFMIACASAMKVYPLVFILLFIADRQYRAALFCVVMTVILTLVALPILHGGMIHNVHLLLNPVKDVQNMTTSVNSFYFSLSLFLLLYKGLQYVGISTAHLYTFYYAGIFILLVLLALYVFFIKQALWKKTFLIVAAMLLFPPFSAHYKLMHLFLPLALFINETSGDHDEKDVSYLIMFIVLFIPLNYGYSDISVRELFGPISNAIDPAVLILGSIAIIVNGLRDRSDNRRGVLTQ